MNLENCSTHHTMNKRMKHVHSKRNVPILVFALAALIIFNAGKEWIDRRNAMREMREPIIVAFPLRGGMVFP